MLDKAFTIFSSRNVLAVFWLVCLALPSSGGATQLDEERAKALARLAIDINETDSRLNAIYKELLLRLNDRGKFWLQEVQRAWIPYRNRECKFREEIEGYGVDRERYELAEKRCLLEMTNIRTSELEKAERQINPDPVIVIDKGASLSWPNYLGKSGEEGVTCLSGSTELAHKIQDRLGHNHTYTTACQITESLFLLLDEQGGNRDPLDVLDLTRRGGPIKLIRGLPWAEKLLKDKSGTLHIVVGGAGLSLGFYGSTVRIYSTKSWEGVDLAHTEGIDNGSSLECPEKGGYGYETIKNILEAIYRYEDHNSDGFEDIVVETVTTTCATHKSRSVTKVFLATENGFKVVTPLETSQKSNTKQRRSGKR
ncbi:MAG: lysozyme inhibitor LprI family protein [Nitrospira sp.]